MKKILLIVLAITSFVFAELPSYQCKEINNATFINAKGEIMPEVNSASGSILPQKNQTTFSKPLF